MRNLYKVSFTPKSQGNYELLVLGKIENNVLIGNVFKLLDGCDIYDHNIGDHYSITSDRQYTFTFLGNKKTNPEYFL